MTQAERKPAPAANKSERLTLRLAPSAVRDLQEISRLYGDIPISEVVRRAIGTERFFARAQSGGRKVFVAEGSDKPLQEVVFLR